MRCARILAVALAALSFHGGVRADDDPVIGNRRVSEWFRALRDESDATRRQAMLALLDTRGGPKVGAVFPGLARELREHPDAPLRARIVSLMPKYKDKGEDVLNAVKGALADKDGRVREAAAVALARFDRQAFITVPELTAALKDKEAAVRAAAAQTLGSFSRTDPEIARDAVPALCDLLADSAAPARLQAAYALGRMGPSAAAAAEPIARALPLEKDAAIRKELAKTAAAIGPKAAPATLALAQGLRDQNADVRQACAIALGRIGPDAAGAIQDLLKAAREDKDRSVRCHAIHAIGALGKAGVAAIPELIEILRKDEVADVRVAVIEELAGFGPDARAAVDVLTSATRDGRPAIREAALEALKKVQQSP